MLVEVIHAYNPSSLRRLRQEDGKFEASLGDLTKVCVQVKRAGECFQCVLGSVSSTTKIKNYMTPTAKKSHNIHL